MSEAYDTLMGLTEDEIAAYTATPKTEEHIVIGQDRIIIIPNALKRIAVQYDHNVETVTFDCPRYWDEHDLSTMPIYINYILPNKEIGSYMAENITAEDTIFHFDWTISNNVTQEPGPIVFLVCAKTTDDEGNETTHWNSELNSEMYISEGLEGGIQTAIDMYPDIITQLLTRMTAVEEVKPIAENAAAAAEASATEAKTSETAVSEMMSTTETYKETARTAAVKATQQASKASSAAASQVGTKADAIVHSGEGESIVLTDASDDPLRGLRVMGRTKQLTTTGKNLVDMSDYEFDDSNYTHMLYASNSASANDFYNLMRAHPGETIIYSMTMTGTASGIDVGSIRFYGEGNALICALVPNTAHTILNELPETFTASYIYGSTTGASVKDIQVEFGSEVTDFEPYTGAKPSPNPDYPQELNDVVSPGVTITGKNLFDMSAIPDTDNITRLNDGTLSVSQYYNQTNTKLSTLAPGLKVGMKVVLDLDTDGCTFIYLTTYARVWDKGGVLEITQQMLDSHVCIYGKTEQTDGSTIIRGIQIRLYDCASGIESYAGTQTLSVPYTLRGIPVTTNGNYTDSNGQQWYCDEIDFERGVYIQRCFLETLTFTPQTELNRYSATITHRANASVATDNGIPVICTTYQFDPLCGSGSPTISGIRIAATSPLYAIAYYNGEVIEEATILYPLDTPIETELTGDDLTAYKELYTNHPNTVVLNDANTYMYLDYNVDTEMYIEDEIESAVTAGTEGLMHYAGVSMTTISNGSTIKNIVISGGSMITATKGTVAKCSSTTYVFDGSAWNSL